MHELDLKRVGDYLKLILIKTYEYSFFYLKG